MPTTSILSRSRPAFLMRQALLVGPLVAISATDVTLIRPCDERARDALRQLGDIAGMRVRRGSVTLADGERHPALLAISGAGAVLVAALLDDTAS